MAESAAVSCNLNQGGHDLPGAATYARVERALHFYRTQEDRELAIANLSFLSGYASSHVGQLDCRMLLIAMRSALLHRSAHSPESK